MKRTASGKDRLPRIGKTIVFCVRIAICVCAAFLLHAHAATLSIAEYREQLQNLSRRVRQLQEHPEQAIPLENDIPEQVAVGDESREYSTRFHWLKQDLKMFSQADSQARPKLLQRIEDRLQLLQIEAEGYETAGAVSSFDRQRLQKILARREFNRAAGPTWWEIIKEKIKRRIIQFFVRHPINGRSATDVLQILVYVVLAVAFAMFAIWIKRRLERPHEDFAKEIIPFAPSDKRWASWLADARSAAEANDWRNGVHFAYWAAISYLEEHGAWKPDQARTPREYLRILGTRKPQYPVLSALTRRFERIWYGHHEAQAEDFSEALQQLEKLGCK
jgi:Domain of unknown function (DUF4129)